MSGFYPPDGSDESTFESASASVQSPEDASVPDVDMDDVQQPEQPAPRRVLPALAAFSGSREE